MKRLSIQELDKIIKASADINRVRILKMLKDKKMCVCEIAAVLAITQPSVSRHLKKLKDAGFIESENEGLWTNYFLCPQNPFAVTVIEKLDSWIGTDKTITDDQKAVRKADRGRLCCP
ncbi:MAG: metalloregulator ArsR/SmtB family transcription factor [Candidatus Omnitrophota bacterium]